LSNDKEEVDGKEWGQAILDHKGFLLGLSPEEPRHALIMAIAREIQRGVPEDDLLKWKRLCLSTLVEFRVVSSLSAMFKFAIQGRENIGAEFQTLYPSTVA
jgi:hypothetical protein